MNWASLTAQEVKRRASRVLRWLASPMTVMTVALAVWFGVASGTPYVRRHSACLVAHHRCGPPTWCHYIGLEGNRVLTFLDADKCPLIVFTPRVSPGSEGRTGMARAGTTAACEAMPVASVSSFKVHSEPLLRIL